MIFCLTILDTFRTLISGKPVIDYGSLQPDDAIANVIQESEERLGDVLNNVIKNNEGASSSSTEIPYQREVIPINELKSGTPIIGQMLPPALRAPVLELTFSGSEVATLKFAAPNCLLASTKIVDAQKNSLRILATFRVPAHASLPGSRMVSRLSDIPSIPCHWFLYDPILDSVLSQQASHEGNGLYNFTFLNPEQTVINIRPQFLTIAGMGDSYAAGEGAPDRFNPVTKVATWEMEQCHRSKNSRFTQGAQKLTEIPGVWILYQNFACSGASINEGILGNYVGIPRPFGSVQPLPLDSQLNQVKRWLNEQGIAELDALILGIGGNDTGFGQIVADCASPLVSNCIVHPPLQQSVFRGEPGSTAVIGFQNLPAMYDVLAQALKGISRQIFITDYPDPTRWGGRPDGTFSEWCTLSTDDEDYGILPSDLFWGDINAEHPLARYLKVGAKASNLEQSEVAWMYNDVLRRLNNEVRAAAQRHEWRLISGFVEHSYDRGFCLRKRFINTFRDSIEDIQGDVFGSVHPNKEAYHLYGEIIARDLALFFRLPDRPNIMVVDEVHPEYPRGPGFQPPVLNSVITGRQRFEIQIAPTTRSLNVMFEIVRRNRFSGNLIQGEQQIQAYRVPGYQSRLQYFVEWDLNPCERLEYRWRIQHSGTGGVKTTATNRRSIIPDAQANELNSCPK